MSKEKNEEFVQDALHHYETHKKWLQHAGNSHKLQAIATEIYEDINGFLGQFADKLSEDELEHHMGRSSAVFYYIDSLQEFGRKLHEVSNEAKDPTLVKAAVDRFNNQFGNKLSGIADLNPKDPR